MINRRKFVCGATATLIGGQLPLAAFAQAKRGGVFRQAVPFGSSTDTLDPARFDSDFSKLLGYGQLRNNLVEYDVNNRIAPALAKEWSVSNDVLIWRLSLRRDVTFHNGKSFTASDVVASINYHRGEAVSSPLKNRLEIVEAINRVDDFTIEIVLKTPNVEFLDILADVHMVIGPTDGGGTVDWLSGIGTGGYVLEKFEPGVSALTKRNVNYWKGDTAAFFDEIESIIIGDLESIEAAIVAGEVHAIGRISPSQFKRLQSNDNLTSVSVPSSSYASLPMHVDFPPFDNTNVRNAVRLAINRQEIAKKIFVDGSIVGNDHPIPPFHPFYNSDLPQRQFDPEQSASLLKRAGLSNLSLDLHVSDAPFSGAVDMAQLVSASASKAGINVNVIREPQDGYWSTVWNRKGWSVSAWSSRTSAYDILNLAYASKAFGNETHWSSDAFDNLLNQSRAELDLEKRRSTYFELQNLVYSDSGAIIPNFRAEHYVFAQEIGYSGGISNTGPYDGYKNGERWFRKTSGPGAGTWCDPDQKWCEAKNQCIPENDDCN